LWVRGGRGRLIDALVAELAGVDIRSACPAESLRVDGPRVAAVVTASGEELPADAVVLAVPAPVAARLLENGLPEAAAPLRDVRYSASAVVLLGYEPHAIARPLDGSGYLVAPEEHAVVAACSWLPSKWVHAASPDRLWLRAVVTDPQPLTLPDDDLV